MRALASLWDLWSVASAERNKSHSLAAGTRSGPVCPPTEDLKDFLGSKKTFKSGEEIAGSIDNIGNADTLPSEGFLEAGDLLDCLKKDWRRPAAPLLRRQSVQLQTERRAGDTHQSFIDIQACGTFLDREQGA